MPTDVTCPSCSRRLRMPDAAVGKTMKCPNCQGMVPVPVGTAATPTQRPKPKPAPAASTTRVPPVKKWRLKMETGEEYGPIPKRELDQWIQEGRLTADCQVLKEGGAQWQWASDVYPSLASPTASPTNANSPAPTTSNQPFDFAATSNPTMSHSSPRRYVRRSPQVDLVVMGFYLFTFLCFLRPLIVMLVTSSMVPDTPEGKAATAFLTVIAFLVGGFISLFYLIPGIGLSKRHQWARIMALIIAALTGLAGLTQSVFSGGQLALKYDYLEYMNAVPMTIIDLIIGLMSFIFAIFCYAILLSKQASKEFKREKPV